MDPIGEDNATAVREALAVVHTSSYLIRKHLDVIGVSDAYLEKHFARLEQSVEQAAAALEPT